MSSEKKETIGEREARIARLEKIDRLQRAALELIKSIDQDLTNPELEAKAEAAPEGIFRVSATKEKMDQQMEIVNATGTADIKNLSQIERAALLKTVFRELRDLQAPLSCSSNSMTSDSVINQVIASKLFQLFNRLISEAFVNKTQMNANNLSIAIGPSLFPVTEVKNETPIAGMQRTKKESELAATVLTPLINEPPKAPKVSQIELHSTHYQHAVDDAQHGRFHAKKVHGSDKMFKDLKTELQGLKGDHLKSEILKQFKGELEKITSHDGLKKWLDTKEKSAEYQVLKTGQGFMTRTFHLETSSIKALNEMVAEQKLHIDIQNLSEDEPSSPKP